MVAQQQPFDILAETYDEDFSHSHIGKLQRERVWDILHPLLNTYNKPINILELNCGTGEDAIKLASLGHNVVATDASAVMIAKAKNKLQQNGQLNNIEFMQADFAHLETSLSNEKFDLVFSNFGGLNCIDSSALKKLSLVLSKHTYKNSHLFFVVMSSMCLWETIYYSFRFKFSTAFRRWKKKAAFVVEDKSMPVYYYSPGKFKTLFNDSFEYKENLAVGLFVPPSYFESFFARHQSLLRKLNSLDRIFGKLSFTGRFADHYCIVFKKGDNK